MSVSDRMQMSIFSESVRAKCEWSLTLDSKWQQQHEPFVLGTAEDGLHAFQGKVQLHHRNTNVHGSCNIIPIQLELRTQHQAQKAISSIKLSNLSSPHTVWLFIDRMSNACQDTRRLVCCVLPGLG